MRRDLFICLLLATVTLAIYWPVRQYGIIYYDDPLFVTENAEINSGLNWHSLWWALSGVLVANWHPVTSLSFVLGHAVWGTNPGAEHTVNVLFHAASAVLLFLVLRRMTSFVWRSAVVAAIFAWHPLRVESVAWIAERKDVLSVFFFMLTLFAYALYAEQSKVRSPKKKETGETSNIEHRTSNIQHPPVFAALRPGKTSNVEHSTFNIQRSIGIGRWWYWAAVFLFALGLMSKPMLVTLPFVLLLLDFWPIQRFNRSTIQRLVVEKWPFFLLSAVISGVTYWVQKSHAAVRELDALGWGDRLGNAVTSYLQYLAKLVWPAKLAVIYPYPKSQDTVEVWLTVLLLVAISAGCIVQLTRRPWLAVGWFWYLGTAVPIIGLVQVGGQAMADRYTYIPLIGPVISLVWLVSERFKTDFSRHAMLAPATALLLGVCALQSRWQVQFWRNTVALSEHTIAVTGDNAAAEFCLAVGLEHEGRLNEALTHYRIQAMLTPEDYRVHYSLAKVLEKQGRWAEAVNEYNDATGLGAGDDYEVQVNLADALSHLGRAAEAVQHLEAALRAAPDSVEIMNNLAWLLATSGEAGVRDGARAVQLAERACALTGYRQTIYVGTLAAAYAAAGRFEDAVATAQKACALAGAANEPGLLKRNQELLELYRQHQPYRETR